jgi:hypothetical protein
MQKKCAKMYRFVERLELDETNKTNKKREANLMFLSVTADLINCPLFPFRILNKSGTSENDGTFDTGNVRKLAVV